jgi:NAD(P)-dependent dehydrogenase (short-subunit alcohol dehydrogenase family)
MRAVLPTMLASRSGRILNMSSIGGYRGAAGFGIYSSTKFAVEGLSEALHAELAPLGMHVTVVEPGYFRTDLLDPPSLSISSASEALYDFGKPGGTSPGFDRTNGGPIVFAGGFRPAMRTAR